MTRPLDELLSRLSELEEKDAWDFAFALLGAWPALRKALEEMERDAGWRPMVSAPLDGAEITLLVRHFDYWTALKVDGKDVAERDWQEAARGKWIDHNGGGWTWRGLAGTPVGWKPIDAALNEAGEKE